MSRTGEEEIGQEEYILYGNYRPLTVTITHILNNKSGINFATYAHTGLPVPVFAQGAVILSGSLKSDKIFEEGHVAW